MNLVGARRLKAALAARAEAEAEERILRDLVGELADKGVYETFRWAGAPLNPSHAREGLGAAAHVAG